MFTKLKKWKLLLLLPCLLLVIPFLPKSQWKQANSLAAQGRYFQALYHKDRVEDSLLLGGR